MHKAVTLASLMVVVGLAGCLGGDNGELDGTPIQPGRGEGGIDDAVVVAVLDFGFNPYHWDFLADHMPQHVDEDPGNDLPLDDAPHTWLPGFPAEPESAFASYNRLNLTLTPDNPDADPSCEWSDGGNIRLTVPPSSTDPVECEYEEGGLYQKDADAWDNVTLSTADEVHLNYIPGTKVVGFLNFDEFSEDGFATASHGGGSSSVSAGNIYGTCPECVFVFVNFGPGALDWINQQDWIDVVTNSYGAGSYQLLGLARDNIYDNCNVDLEREAVERGQTIIWSAGNGLANAFAAPPNTLTTCEKGLDWVITVGAINPSNDASYTGHGKPVNVANIGSNYPRHGGANVTAEGSFGGTSNAAPVTAGLYAGALYDLRTALPGPSRMQAGGVIASGDLACGEANAECAFADGELTVHELRHALFRAATPTSAHLSAPFAGEVEGNAETELWTEGHGSFHGRLGDYVAERSSIVGHATGDLYEEESQESIDWMTAYSYCAQQVWGSWDHGYWTPESALPQSDPNWPYRSWLGSEACPQAINAIVTAGSTTGPTHPGSVTNDAMEAGFDAINAALNEVFNALP